MRYVTLAALATLVATGSARAELAAGDLDPAVKPQDDFYHYANGGWLKQAEIPAQASSWGTVAALRERDLQQLKMLCERASAQGDQGSPAERLVGDFYASGMDTDAMDEAGAQPIRFEFDRIDALTTPAEVLTEIAHLQSLGVDVGFSFGSAPDPRDPTQEIAVAEQGGLGLPNREDYLRPEAQPIRTAYAAHIARMLLLLGGLPSGAQTEAAAVLRLETTLASASGSGRGRREGGSAGHFMTVAEAETATPGFAWRSYLAQTGAPAFTAFQIGEPEFFRVFGVVLTQTPVADWQAYLRWHFVHHFAPYLGSSYVREDFSFYGAALTGAKAITPQWQRTALTIDRTIGEALGAIYTDEYFTPAAKAQATALVANLQQALRDEITVIPWMDPPTRTLALAKLGTLRIRLGAPDHPRDYAGLVIDRGPYVLNVLKAEAFEFRRRLKLIGQRTDPAEWTLSPSLVHAAYRQAQNDLTLPAALFQPPLFDPQADPAANYGAVGTAIAREMIHLVDAQGRHYDAQGRLHDWWSAPTAAQFAPRAAAIVQQFNGYSAGPGLNVNGTLTEGDNIADLGGVKVAYAAFESALGAAPREASGGFTPEQRFFLSFAALRREVYRPAELRRVLQSEPHAPGEFRTNGTLANLSEFAAAFQVPAGAPMRRAVAEAGPLW